MEDQKSTFNPFKTKRYIAIAKEPVYVGTGGYRIGRVDNTIIRDPATNLPKIPGSTISGNARYYSWLAYRSKGMDLNLGCSKGKKTNGENACGKCPICLTYGFINDGGAQSGLAYFSDARILFFPVATMLGTVWVTSDEIVKEFIDTDSPVELTVSEDEFYCSNEMDELPKGSDDKEILNFGWIMLKKKESKDINVWKLKNNEFEEVPDLTTIFNEIENKLCIVSSKVFHHIVNSNLETRTSVSINPVTGAAESGALFTYEALPRGTVFIFDVTYENPKNYGKDEFGEKDGLNIIIGTVEKGFDLFSSLGIGGMGTRGFGKIEIKEEILNEKEYWKGIQNFIHNLSKRISKLGEEIANEADDSKKKKLEEEQTKLEETKRLWIDYIKEEKKQRMKKQKQNNELISLLDSILKEEEDGTTNN